MTPDELRELYEHRLTKTVAANVEDAIRRKFVWVNIASGLAFLGVSWLGGSALLTSEVKERVNARVEAAVKDRKGEIDVIIAEMQARTIEAKVKLAQIDEALNSAVAREKAIKEDMRDILTQSKSILDATIIMRRNSDDIALLKQSLGVLDALNGRVAEMSSLLQDLAQPRSDLSSKAASLNNAAVSDQISSSLSSTSQSLAKPTVYVQFSGKVSRAAVKQVSSALEARLGVRIPGEERRAASRIRQVRYYYDTDADLAARTAEAAKLILQQQGFGSIGIDVASFEGWEGNKPAPGTIELWLSALPEPSS